jgi:hypothetical protein
VPFLQNVRSKGEQINFTENYCGKNINKLDSGFMAIFMFELSTFFSSSLNGQVFNIYLKFKFNWLSMEFVEP